MSQPAVPSVFGSYEQEALPALFIDYPEAFYSVADFVKPEMFDKPEAVYIMHVLQDEFRLHGHLPSRALLRDQIARQIVVDELYAPIFKIIDTPVNERDVASLRDRVFTWARQQSYGLLYAPETISAYQAGQLETIDKIVADANKIANVTINPLWVFESADELTQPMAIERLSTGYKKLDMYLNDGGPSPGEVICYMAPPNVGKSAVLINCAVNSALLNYNTLVFSLEMTDKKTAIRSLGSISEIPMRELNDRKGEVMAKINRLRTGIDPNKLGIVEMGALEVSIAHIERTVEYLKRTNNWVPKVIVIDYLELMISCDSYANRDEYLRQKRVATELLTLAKKLNVLVYTASQGNRGSVKAETIKMEDMAESFGKNMPLSYVITLNQTEVEYAQSPPQLRWYIAKNREGPKNIYITCTMDYTMMKLKEIMINE